MIKKIIFCTLLLLNLNVFSQKQISSGEINYEVTLEIDEDKLKALNKKSNISEQDSKMVISKLKNQDKIHFKLLFNKNESIFKEDKKLEVDDKKNDLIKIITGKGIFYTDKNSKKIVNQKESFGELFLIDVPKVKWTLTQERKKIGNYVCYKATTEKESENRKGKFITKIMAWYAPELPINYGPKDYFGLPGLILELRKGDLLFKASKINLSNKDIKIKKPTKGKKVTLEEYTKITKKLIDDYHKR